MTTSAVSAAGRKEFFDTYRSALAELDALPRSRLTVADLDRDLAGGSYRRSIGVYGIWEGNRFLYVGICVTVPDGPETQSLYADSPGVLTVQPNARGLYGRLRTHAEGWATDRLWLPYAEQRLIPNLTPEESAKFEHRELNLQTMIRVRSHEGRFQYQLVATATPGVARAIEAGVRRHGLPGAGLPALNPIQ
jgi:hypothetical protein